MDRELIKLGAKIELARREFFFYCQLKAPDFYKADREYLVTLCNELQDFIASDEPVAIINTPPRHGKSRTAGLLVEWLLGKDQTQKIMTGSYNETLSTMFSKNVRNSIQEEKADMLKPVFSDVFPEAKIRRGDGAMNLWSLEGGYNNYLATSPTGTATGFGATLLLIDDLIKNAEEAYNEGTKEKHWEWFTNTMLSRLEEGGKIIIIMTRWASDDLAGRAIDFYKEQNVKIRHVNMKALIDAKTKEMLCSEVLSYKSYQAKVSAMGEDIAAANYQQEPIDQKGRLYTTLTEYEPADKPQFTRVFAYGDTADTGSDYLAAFICGETFDHDCYILDVVYTKDAMEITEPLLAERLIANDANYCLIESNNGGRGFARNVQSELKSRGWTKTVIDWFFQSKNKKARILSNSTWVMQHIFFPKGWRHKWPELHRALNKYQKEGKNAHDDAPDALTGIAEMAQGKKKPVDVKKVINKFSQLGL